jgi:formylmethanofuran dehydrogenase subunit E
MAGCYGSHPFDRHFEQELDRHLDYLDSYSCDKCGWEGRDRELKEDENGDMICPGCGEII